MTNSKKVSQFVSEMAEKMELDTLKNELGNTLKSEFTFDTVVDWDGDNASIYVKEDSTDESIVMNVLDVKFS